MGKFLNSEIAQQEEAAAKEVQHSAELLDALGQIAELHVRMMAMGEVIRELSLENSQLRIELKMIQPTGEG